MDVIKRTIEDILKYHGDVKRGDLLEMLVQRGFLREDSQSTQDRRLRKVVKEMVEESGVPVGSSPGRGYFLCENQSDFDDATISLQKKLNSLSHRIRSLKDSIEEVRGEQILMKEIVDGPTMVDGQPVVDETIEEAIREHMFTRTPVSDTDGRVLF